MKLIYSFVLIMFVFVAKADYPLTECTDYTPDGFLGGNQSAFSLDFCRTTVFDTDTYAKCCFLQWEDKSGRRRYNCMPATHYNFSDISTFKDAIENKLGEVKSIDCKSSYLYGSVFLILVLLF